MGNKKRTRAIKKYWLYWLSGYLLYILLIINKKINNQYITSEISTGYLFFIQTLMLVFRQIWGYFWNIWGYLQAAFAAAAAKPQPSVRVDG